MSVEQGHDYQRSMSADALDLDQEGENAAANKTKTTSETRTYTERGKDTIIRDVGVMGLLPDIAIPADFAIDKAAEFREMAAATGGHHGGQSTAAFSSQLRMATNYTADATAIEQAQRDYDTLVPLANMAARSVVKSNTVRDGVGDSARLNAKTAAILGDVNQDGRGMKLAQGLSVSSKAQAVSIARQHMNAAAHKMASAVQMNVVADLEKQLAEAKEKREEIEKKIEQAAHFVGYIETIGAMVAGGAAAASLAGVGKAEAVGESFESAGSEIVEKVGKSGDVAEKGGGLLEKATAFGVGLFYEAELDKIGSEIEVVSRFVRDSRVQGAKDAMEGTHGELVAATNGYKAAVEELTKTINDRRALMAAMGKDADKAVDKTGSNGDASEAMLNTTSLLETQALMQMAMEAGGVAQKSVDDGETSVRHHRTEQWGTLSDWSGQTNTPNQEGLGGPDVAALKQMRSLTDWWQEGAANEMKELKQDVSSDANPVMDALGYHADY
jgi:hypothetical protein